VAELALPAGFVSPTITREFWRANMTETVVDHLVARFRELGVVRMFGVPGGGSSLDLIESAGRACIEFVLCRTETTAAFMAAVSAELTGVPGVVLSTGRFCPSSERVGLSDVVN